jgi:hypothetical protein
VGFACGAPEGSIARGPIGPRANGLGFVGTAATYRHPRSLHERPGPPIQPAVFDVTRMAKIRCRPRDRRHRGREHRADRIPTIVSWRTGIETSSGMGLRFATGTGGAALAKIGSPGPSPGSEPGVPRALTRTTISVHAIRRSGW